MARSVAAALAAAALAAAATAAPLGAQWPVIPANGSTLVVTVDFSPTGTVAEQSGNQAPVTPSGLTPAQEQIVIDHIQDNFARAGVNVLVLKGTGGDREVLVSGGFDPEGPFSGDAGTPGGPSIVFAARSAQLGATGDDLARNIATTAAHEIGHRLGLTHNTNGQQDKMTDPTPFFQANAGVLHFSNADAAIMQTFLGQNLDPDLGAIPGGLPVDVGRPLGPLGDDEAWPDKGLDVSATIAAPAGTLFGYVNRVGAFVPFPTLAEGAFFTGGTTLLYTGGWNMAAHVGGVLYTLLGGGAVTLRDANPFNPAVFSTATLTFATASGPAALTLTAREASTGGFVAIPEPASVVLLAAGLATVGGLRRLRGGTRDPRTAETRC